MSYFLFILDFFSFSFPLLFLITSSSDNSFFLIFITVRPPKCQAGYPAEHVQQTFQLSFAASILPWSRNVSGGKLEVIYAYGINKALQPRVSEAVN